MHKTIDSDHFEFTELADLPHPDVFAKTRRFWEFVSDARAKRHVHYRRQVLGPCKPRSLVLDPYDGKPREMIMLGSNNYLGLTYHPKVIEGAAAALRKYGAGSGSVPHFAGTTDLHIRAEEALADLVGCEACVTFASGYSNMLGVVSALLGSHDHALADMFSHASLVDGCKLSGVKVKHYPHNDVRYLEHQLKRLAHRTGGVLIITDGVFSMDGDIAPLDQIVPLARRYGARVMVDEAHATGVVGPGGRGTAEHCGVFGQVDIVCGTLSKALGSVGGFVAASREVVEFVLNFARSYMFATSLPPAACGAIVAAVDVVRTEPEIRERLHANVAHMVKELQGMGLDTGRAQSGIVPILIGTRLNTVQLRELARRLHERGLFTNVAIYPAVPPSLARIRLGVMADHTVGDLDESLDIIETVCKEVGLL